jgi:hypothetical protein
MKKKKKENRPQSWLTAKVSPERKAILKKFLAEMRKKNPLLTESHIVRAALGMEDEEDRMLISPADIERLRAMFKDVEPEESKDDQDSHLSTFAVTSYCG